MWPANLQPFDAALGPGYGKDETFPRDVVAGKDPVLVVYGRRKGVFNGDVFFEYTTSAQSP